MTIYYRVEQILPDDVEEVEMIGVDSEEESRRQERAHQCEAGHGSNRVQCATQ